MTTNPITPPQEPTLGDLWPKIKRCGWLFALMTILGTAIGIGYTVWVPARYEASASFLLPSTRPTPSGGAGALAASLGASVPTGDTTLAMFRKILESDRLLKEVAAPEKLDPEELKIIRRIEDDNKANVISIYVTNRDRELALRLTKSYLDALRRVNKELSLPSKGRKSDLLLRTLANRERSLRDAEDALERFTRSSKTAPGVPTTSTTTTGPSAPSYTPAFRYQEQLTSLGIELDTLARRAEVAKNRSTLSANSLAPDYPPVSRWSGILQQQEAKIAQLRSQFTDSSEEVEEAQRAYRATLTAMEKDVRKYAKMIEEGLTGGVAGYSDERQAILKRLARIQELADAAPAEATEYQRLTRAVSTLTTVVTQLRIQAEQAKLDKEDDPNRWEVLDKPYVGDKPINKRYSRNTLLAVFGLNLMALAYALLRRTPK